MVSGLLLIPERNIPKYLPTFARSIRILIQLITS